MEERRHNIEASVKGYEINSIFAKILKKLNKNIGVIAAWLSTAVVILGAFWGYISFKGDLENFENSIANVEADVREVRENIGRANENAAAAFSRMSVTNFSNLDSYEDAISGLPPGFAGNQIVFLSGCAQRADTVTCYLNIANSGSTQHIIFYLNKDNARISSAILENGASVQANRIVDQNGRSVTVEYIEPGRLPNWHLAQTLNSQQAHSFSVHFPVGPRYVRRLASISLRIQEDDGGWDGLVVFEDIPVVLLE